jgi:hypothetical protein
MPGEGPKRGYTYTYTVSDEQLRAFRRLTPRERLRWLDETRDFLVRNASAETKRWWAKLRRGD